MALENELALIQRQAYIEQAARQFRLGTPSEVPFALADDAPALAPDAPGSATARLGTDPSADAARRLGAAAVRRPRPAVRLTDPAVRAADAEPDLPPPRPEFVASARPARPYAGRSARVRHGRRRRAPGPMGRVGAPG